VKIVPAVLTDKPEELEKMVRQAERFGRSGCSRMVAGTLCHQELYGGCLARVKTGPLAGDTLIVVDVRLCRTFQESRGEQDNLPLRVKGRPRVSDKEHTGPRMQAVWR
jgi:hypothetical protein